MTQLRLPTAYLLACAANLAVRPMDEQLRPYGLSVRQMGLLAQLQREPELTSTELARQLGIARQSTHELISGLEHADYLRRRPGATGRTRRLEISPGTDYVLSRLAGSLSRAEDGLLGLSQQEVATLRTLLQSLLAHVTDDEAWLMDATLPRG